MLTIPESHRDLFERPVHAVLTTMMPDGQPQSSLMWCDCADGLGRINTTRERQKGRNMQANPKVTLLLIDPDNVGRWIEIRGEVQITEQGALDHLDALTRKYTAHPCFYGYVYPVEQQSKETRITCTIIPTRITLDAIH